MKITKIICIIFFHLLCSFSIAQTGDIDISFNSKDVGFGHGDKANGEISALVIQNDNKIIIVGSFSSYNAIPQNHIARLNIDGNLDTSFNIGSGANDAIYAVCIQKDGKLIIVGKFTSYNGVSRNKIARINTDGSLDVSFDPGSGTDKSINAVAVQNDGKIIIGGDFFSYNGIPRNYITRINTNGSLDTSFITGTGASSSVLTTSIQNDGKIIIGGYFSSINGVTRNCIARLNTDGQIDTTFKKPYNSSTVYFVRATAFQSDGKIIIGGNFTKYDGVTINRIARLHIDGTLDTSFNSGTGANNWVNTIAVQNDGKIIAGGDFTLFNGIAKNYLVRLNTNGSIDNYFTPKITGLNPVKHTLIQSDGKIIIGRSYIDILSGNTISRLNTDSSLDSAFNRSTGANGQILVTTLQNDGKIIIGGAFTLYNGITRNILSRLNKDGSLDTTFNPGFGPNNFINTISVQSDEKIIIGGAFSAYNGISRKNIARLNADGSLDYSFDPINGTNSTVLSSAIQNDGKIIIGGYFTSYNGISRSGIARLNTDGSLDNTFDPGTGLKTYPSVNTIVIQSDGKIIIGGSFSSYNGTSISCLARLNTNGTLDNTFNPTAGNYGFIHTCNIQSDKKIIIGGRFSSYNGKHVNIARLNNDGSVDSTFISNSGPNNDVDVSVIQKNGKVIIGGSFTSYNNKAYKYLARLNADGSLDTSFISGVGPNGYIYSMAFQDPCKLIICGNFISYNGIGRNRIARLLTCEPTSYSINDTACGSYTYNGNNYTSSGIYTQTIGDSIQVLNLTINPLPVVIANASASRVCAGSQVILTGNGANNYLWSDNVTNGIAFIPQETNIYTVTGMDTNGCQDSATVSVSVIELPSTPIILLNKDTLESNSTIGNQWYFNNTIIPNAVNSLYKPHINGDYYVVVTADNCASKPSNLISYLQTSFFEIETINTVCVFPNPTDGFVTVQLPITSSDIIVELHDISGFKMFNWQLKYNGKEFEINLSKYPNGVYTVIIFAKTANYQIKIVKL